VPLDLLLRDATEDDAERLGAIAAEGDSHDADPGYLAFVASLGRLTIAVSGGAIVAFGGMMPIGEIAMVTDLFVATAARGQGVGGALLDALLAGRPLRMTCSSQHAAALPTYRRAGMEPVDRLLYLDGVATGGGPPLAPRPWQHERSELVNYFAAQGALVAGDVVVHHVAGRATVLRLQHAAPFARMRDVLAALPEGTAVRAHVPAGNPLAAQLIAAGFVVVDHDVICASSGVKIPDAGSCVHAGLF
jgi:GNAT superfamily N-acetyltransferase